MSRLEENIAAAQALRRAGRTTRSIAQLMGKSAAWVEEHAPELVDDPDGGPEPKIVDVFICKLRRKLETLSGCIETVWGQGYLLNSEGRRRLNVILGIAG